MERLANTLKYHLFSYHWRDWQRRLSITYLPINGEIGKHVKVSLIFLSLERLANTFRYHLSSYHWRDWQTRLGITYLPIIGEIGKHVQYHISSYH